MGVYPAIEDFTCECSGLWVLRCLPDIFTCKVGHFVDQLMSMTLYIGEFTFDDTGLIGIHEANDADMK